MPITLAVIERHARAEHMARVVLHHRDEVTANLDRITRPVLDCVGLRPDYDNVQKLQAVLVLFYFERLWEAELAYQTKKDTVFEVRDRRDELTRALYDKIVALRGVLERLYSRKAASGITGFEGKTPRDPYELGLMGIFLLARLRKVDLSKLPEPALPADAVSLDLEGTAHVLEPLVWELNRVLRDLQNWSLDEDALLELRDQAQKDFDRMYTGAAAQLEGLYTAAGLPEHVPGIRNPDHPAAEASERRLTSPLPTPVVPDSGWAPPKFLLHRVQGQYLTDHSA